MKDEKNVKKKIKIKWLPCLLALVAVFCVYVVYTILVDLPITNIYIYGNNLLNDQEIINLAGISDYPSFLSTTSKDMKNNIKKSPYIENVKIEKKFFGQVMITIEEATALFINVDGRIVLSNAKEVENEKKLTIPTLVNYTPDTKYGELITKFTKVDSEIQSKISEIKYEPTEQDKDRFALYMNDGNLVYVTLTKLSKIDYYNKIISEGDLVCKRGILNLDSGNYFEIKLNDC